MIVANLLRTKSPVESPANALWTDQGFDASFIQKLLDEGAEHLLARQASVLRPSENFVSELRNDVAHASERIEKSFLKGTTDVIEMRFSGVRDKDDALAQFQKATRSFSRLTTRLRQIAVISEELVLNAVFSAAIAYEDFRGSPFQFPEGASFCLRLAFDDAVGILSCEDPIGSLDRERFLKAIARPDGVAIKSERVVENHRVETNGAGCRLILDHCTDLFAVSEANRKTWVGCCFPLNGSAASYAMLPKSLHILVRG